MAESLLALTNSLPHDDLRTRLGFSKDIEETQRVLFDDGTSAAEREDALCKWLAKYQPCLFGRIAAKSGLISSCILDRGDLGRGDEFVQSKIQDARSRWTAEAHEGHRSAFIILLISPAIVYAEPSPQVLSLASRLATLYLLRDIHPDLVYHEDIWLEKPGYRKHVWHWLAGVNYFSANGDQRWWHDHRVPGGIALSVNSVGHMAKSGALMTAARAFDAALGEPGETNGDAKVTSLEKALELAMRTIALAHDGISGPATTLAPLTEGVPSCPVTLPAYLADKDYRKYYGFYHTDFTLPSEYFRPVQERPSDLSPFELDLSYLLDTSFENRDHIRMGAGRRVRRAGERMLRATRLRPDSIDISTAPRLLEALRRFSTKTS